MKRRGFTFVEVIIGIILLSIISISGAVSYFGLSRLNQQNEQQILITNAIQQGFEEVRASAQLNFDNIAVFLSTDPLTPISPQV